MRKIISVVVLELVLLSLPWSGFGVAVDGAGLPVLAEPKGTAGIQARIESTTLAVSFSTTTSTTTTARAKVANRVLLWQPTGYVGGDSMHLVEQLTKAYSELIPSESYFKDAYPEGIAVDACSANVSSTTVAVDLPSSLESYALVFVIYPRVAVTDEQVRKLKSVVERGGRVVLQGENGAYMGDANAILTQLAKSMGADFEITGKTLGGGFDGYRDKDIFNYESDLLKEPLKDGVYPKSIAVAPIHFSGAAQEVARTYVDDLSNFAVWAVDEVSGNGRITALSDMNWYNPPEDHTAVTASAIPFLERLLSNAISNETAVVDEENPNQDIGEVIPDGMVAAVRDENSYLTYYATVVAACSAACAGRAETNRLTVILKRDVRESFTLPVGVTFETTGITTNYDGEAVISVAAGVLLSVNAAHDVYYASTAALPGSPVVSATDGSYTNKVRISWTASDSDLPVTAYHVWRVKVGSTLVTELTNSVTGLSYEDRTAKPGVRYTYYVSAYSSAGWGFEGSDEGWRSVSASVGVADVTARQRYPWNGKVDVDFAITGDAEMTYRVGLAVTDVAGGTNLPVKTVLGETLVSPGRHRLVWDADKDCVTDGELPRLKVSVSAVEELK